jgi:hypothetical protein
LLGVLVMTDPLAGIEGAELFDDAERLAAAMPAPVSRPRKAKAIIRRPRADAKKAQQKRLRALVAEGHIVHAGRVGVTVFWGTVPRPFVFRYPPSSPPPPEPPSVARSRKRRVERWMENHPGEMPRAEEDMYNID